MTCPSDVTSMDAAAARRRPPTVTARRAERIAAATGWNAGAFHEGAAARWAAASVAVATRRARSGAAARRTRALVLRARDRPGELRLRHPRAAADVERLRALVQLLARVPDDVHAPERLALERRDGAACHVRDRTGRARPWPPSGRRPSRTSASATRTRSGAHARPRRTSRPRRRASSTRSPAPSSAIAAACRGARPLRACENRGATSSNGAQRLVEPRCSRRSGPIGHAATLSTPGDRDAPTATECRDRQG